MGNGETDCILCGEVFRFYHHSQKRCSECQKMTCGKCGRDYPLNPSHGSGSGQQQRQSSLTSSSSMSSSLTSLITSAIMGGSANTGEYDSSSTIWLCKICAEQRELKKKSGAWFFKVSCIGNKCTQARPNPFLYRRRCPSMPSPRTGTTCGASRISHLSCRPPSTIWPRQEAP